MANSGAHSSQHVSSLEHQHESAHHTTEDHEKAILPAKSEGEGLNTGRSNTLACRAGRPSKPGECVASGSACSAARASTGSGRGCHGGDSGSVDLYGMLCSARVV